MITKIFPTVYYWQKEVTKPRDLLRFFRINKLRKNPLCHLGVPEDYAINQVRESNFQ